jgi:hypothetical protein
VFWYQKTIIRATVILNFFVNNLPYIRQMGKKKKIRRLIQSVSMRFLSALSAGLSWMALETSVTLRAYPEAP